MTPAAVDPLSVTVVRLALDPATGRIRNRAAVGVAVRGAHLIELALRGHLTGTAGPRPAGPRPADPARTDGQPGVTGDPLLDAVHDAVARRQSLPWPRWFGHTSDDLAAVTRRLTGDGRWEAGPDRFSDRTPELTLQQSVALQALIEGPAPPASVEEGLLALLVAGSGAVVGRPRPRAQKQNARAWIDPFLVGPAGSSPDVARRAAMATLKAMRRQSFLPVLSR